ncbi:unnamed protein product [Trifolium pratense]|uniref:Uncharacterized protein n=1 Tax=Trifolium pratense TaxID=57577 RepID=A0ACB0J7H7_TRIPR|nr:unnamed protein product [Trifolium pratense]
MSIHVECMTYYPSLRIYLHSSCLALGSFEPSYEGTLKLINVDGSFSEDSFCLGVDGVIHSNEGDCVANFSHYEVDGDDALLAELHVIQMRLEFCCSKVCCTLPSKTVFHFPPNPKPQTLSSPARENLQIHIEALFRHSPFPLSLCVLFEFYKTRINIL